MNFIIIWISIVTPVLVSLIAGQGIFHYFQLESYQFPGYFRTLKRNLIHSFLPGLLVYLISVGLMYIQRFLQLDMSSGILNVIAQFGVLVLGILCAYLVCGAFKEKRAKKKFVFTGRVKRLYGVSFVIMLLISWASITYLSSPLLELLWTLFLPFVIALCGLLAWPIEKGISELYFRDARRKLLSNKNMVRIGITGSYGKTSVKHILGTILSEKYPTLITPASFNTPMGVSRAIRERLRPSHQIFVGEMGARHVGDIKEMCRLVKPTIGIITSVGPQHLETFKTVERVAKTKYELIEALPITDSHSYFADDDAIVYNMYNKTNKTKSLCGTNGFRDDCYADQISVSKSGSSFLLKIKDAGTVQCNTKLLGEHNISNIVLAAAVAFDLGLSLRQISHGISKLSPVQHRLELISNPNQFTIINDAYNSNPIGAKAALNVLKGFPSRRIIITPGMVELGKNEAQYNREFGMQMKSCVDIAIIIGKQRAIPIIEGLKSVGFTDKQIYRVDSLADSTELLHRIVKPNDTVLYENDLPDNYQEA